MSQCANFKQGFTSKESRPLWDRPRALPFGVRPRDASSLLCSASDNDILQAEVPDDLELEMSLGKLSVPKPSVQSCCGVSSQPPHDKVHSVIMTRYDDPHGQLRDVRSTIRRISEKTPQVRLPEDIQTTNSSRHPSRPRSVREKNRTS